MNSSTPMEAIVSPMTGSGRSSSRRNRTHDLPASNRFPVARYADSNASRAASDA